MCSIQGVFAFGGLQLRTLFLGTIICVEGFPRPFGSARRKALLTQAWHGSGWI